MPNYKLKKRLELKKIQIAKLEKKLKDLKVKSKILNKEMNEKEIYRNEA